MDRCRSPPEHSGCTGPYLVGIICQMGDRRWMMGLCLLEGGDTQGYNEAGENVCGCRRKKEIVNVRRDG